MLVLLLTVALSAAFTPTRSYSIAKVAIAPRLQPTRVRMGSEFSRPDDAKPDAAETAGSGSTAAKGGKQPQQEEKSREISSEMRDKIRRELQNQGADPNVAAGNPILIVAGVVAVLVIVGGQGFFY